MDAGLRTRHQVFGCFVTIWLVAVCAAQSPPPSTSEAASGMNPRRDVMAESDLNIFWLRSKTGALLPVPDFTLEEYHELIRLREQFIPQDPAPDIYVFQGEIEFTGSATETEAQFQVQLNIRIREQEEDDESPTWVRIPLRLNQAVMMPGARHDGPGEFFVSYVKEGDGYVAWLRATPNTNHAITLNIKLPVTRVAGKLRASLLAPQRPTRLQLDVPGVELDVTTNNLAENILTTNELGTTKTRISMENVGGPLEITWREQGRSVPVLESIGTTRATINGQQIDYEANLRVRSYGGPIRTFEVRLPADAIWIPEPTPGIRIEEVAAASDRKARLVRVTREDGKDESLLEVRLKAFAPDKLLAGQTEVSGFEVIGAVKQLGTLELAVVGDWTIDWFPGSYVRQVPVTDSQRRDGVESRFDYYTQPYSLKVEIQARESRIRVAPTYSLFIEEAQLRLVGNLKYSTSGTRTRELLIQAPGWQIDRVLPADLIGGTLKLDTTTPLSIPLATNGKPLAENFEIRIEAHQPIPVDDRSFRAVMPRTANGVATPASVIVYPADNVDLTLRDEEIKGLIAESAPPDFELPKTQQQPIFYVEESSDTAAVFAGDFEVRSRVVAANVDNTLSFSANTLAVEQRFELEISYEPLRQITFDAPASLPSVDQIQFFELFSEPASAANGGLRERPLPVLGVEPSENSGISEISIGLLDDRIAPRTIAARYTIPIPQGQANEAFAANLMRLKADPSITIGTNKLHLVTDEDVAVELVSEGWDTLIDDLLDPTTRAQLFQTNGDVSAVNVVVRPVQSPQLDGTNLLKFWLKAYLSHTTRLDRACFLLRTDSERIQVQLPAGAKLVKVAVQRFGQPNAKANDDGVVTIELDPEAENNLHTVEVWYEFSARDVPIARLSIDPPTLVGIQHARRSYWQLILPRYEHLLFAPASLTPDYVWRWDFNHWGRQSNRSQADLETALDTFREESPPDQVINQYLFTSVGPIVPVEFITVSRGSLTLALSLTALLAGLCLIYFSWARHPASLLIVGVLVVSLGFVFPEPTILGAQAAGLGIPFVLLARILHRNASRRKSPAIPSSSGSSMSLVDSQEGHAVPVTPEGNSHTTTTLAPTTYQVPIVEPKP